jgi:hypothetical protein
MEAISAQGRERGFVTSQDLLQGLSVEDLSPEQVEGFLMDVQEYLRQEGIEVLEIPGKESEDEVGKPRGIRQGRDDLPCCRISTRRSCAGCDADEGPCAAGQPGGRAGSMRRYRSFDRGLPPTETRRCWSPFGHSKGTIASLSAQLRRGGTRDRVARRAGPGDPGEILPTKPGLRGASRCEVVLRRSRRPPGRDAPRRARRSTDDQAHERAGIRHHQEGLSPALRIRRGC